MKLFIIFSLLLFPLFSVGQSFQEINTLIKDLYVESEKGQAKLYHQILSDTNWVGMILKEDFPNQIIVGGGCLSGVKHYLNKFNFTSLSLYYRNPIAESWKQPNFSIEGVKILNKRPRKKPYWQESLPYIEDDWAISFSILTKGEIISEKSISIYHRKGGIWKLQCFILFEFVLE